DDDVGARELLGDPLERARVGAAALRELRGVVERAIRNEGDTRAAREEIARRLLADLAGADEQDRAPVELAEDLLRECGRSRGDRRGALADRRLRTHLASRMQCLPERTVENEPRSPGLGR